MPEPQTSPPASPTSELSGKGGFFSNLMEHKVMLIGAIVGILFVIYVIAKGRSIATPSSTTGGPVDNSGQQQGSLGNSGYQDSGVAYALTQLGQQLNNLQATMSQQPTTNPPPTPNPTPTPTPTNPNMVAVFANLPPGVRNVLGFHATIAGGEWTIVPGPAGSGRIWGVPGWVDIRTAANTPIQPGGKQLLVNTPPLLNPLAAHSPIQSLLSLTPMADHNYDLSNVGVAARSGLSISSHPGLALQIRS